MSERSVEVMTRRCVGIVLSRHDILQEQRIKPLINSWTDRLTDVKRQRKQKEERERPGNAVGFSQFDEVIHLARFL